MIDVHPYGLCAGHSRPAASVSASRDRVLAELTSHVFASLPRSDQRRKGIQYLNGLLTIQGRKSIRNIANLLGNEVSEQNLHHFISASTWDWVPIRRALADALEAALPTRAWVVRPMTIPKAGRNSVGVGPHFSPALGQTLNAQRAIGVWAVSESASVPVNWRLQLPSSWLMDDPRRSQAAIPEGASPESLAECAAEASRETATGWKLPARPTVLDLGDESEQLLDDLASVRVPLLARVGPDTPLTVTAPAITGREQTTLTAHQIMGMARNMRRPVPRRGPLAGVGEEMTLAAAVRVTSACLPGPEPAHLVLLGTGTYGARWPGELWLSNLTTVPLEHLARLSRLTHRVARDSAVVADRVGIRDFTGRSFTGWHRHVTLASIAHAVTVLAGRPQQRPRIAG
ncbi:IS701 family transposase [Streptomyces salinarius]|uniref:IS701 family transposase n=1 Tax=Streptomyces salinarius TaxID=2762598 RepID=UPI001F0926AB|nr:transposase [Streptomyces salinarius]